MTTATRADQTAASYIGTRFGRWTVIGIGKRRPGARNRVRARCDCGRSSMVELGNLVAGVSTQCAWCGWNAAGDTNRIWPKTPKRCRDCGAPLSRFAWTNNNERCRDCCDSSRPDVPYKYPISIGTIARACGITRQAVSLRVQKFGFGPALAMYEKEHGPIAPSRKKSRLAHTGKGD